MGERGEGQRAGETDNGESEEGRWRMSGRQTMEREVGRWKISGRDGQ